MATILITGANRGIGLGLVKEILTTESGPFETVIATYRNENNDLNKLKDKYPNLYLLKLDVSQFNTFISFAKEVDNIVHPKGLNILVNNAGVTLKNKAGDFKTLTPQEYTEVFNVNTFAPLFLTQALLPLLIKGSKKNSMNMDGVRGAILNMSSSLGSVSDNATGSYWAYRESKAALNQITRSLAKEKEITNHNIVVIALHPGHVKTDMGGPFGKLSVEQSCHSLYRLMTSLNQSMHDKFIQWNEIEIPW